MIRSRFTLELTGWTTFFAFSFVTLVPLGRAQDSTKADTTLRKKANATFAPPQKTANDFGGPWTPPPVVRSTPAKPPARPQTVKKLDSTFKEADAADPQAIKRSRVLRFPVVRSKSRDSQKNKGGTSNEAAEETAFGRALERYQKAGGAESSQGRKALEEFVGKHSDGDYSPSIRLELADAYWRTGAWEKALDQWEKAWARASKHEEQDVEARRLGDVALSQLLKHTALLGRKERLRSLLQEISSRKNGGDVNNALHRAQEMMWFLDNRAEQNVFCGFSAANLVCEPLGKRPIFPDVHDKEEEKKFIATGASLWDIAEHSHEAGGDLRCVQKTDAKAQFSVPSVIHWKFGHFSALTEKGQDGKLHLEDAQLKFNSWVEPTVIAEAGSGYALIPGTVSLPAGYREVSEVEARTVTGRHCVHGFDDEGKDPEKCPCKSKGMAVYSLNLRRAYHSIVDTPLTYLMPDGKEVSFTLSYSARPAGNTSLSNTYGFGPLWFSPFAGGSLKLTGTGTPNSSIEWHMGNGSYTTYSLQYGNYVRKQNELPTLAYLADDGDGRPGYRLSFYDGSYQNYTWAANSPTTTYLLTRDVDPQGNTQSYGYDSSSRLVSVIDSWGNESVISYIPEAGDAASATTYPKLIRRITNPFGRYATFIYDSSGRLVKITDAVGITSQFQYSYQDIITSLTTPYGTTNFLLGYNSIEVTDTRGFKEKVIQTDNVPVSILNASGEGGAGPATNLTVRDWDSSDGYHGDRTARAPISVNGTSFLPKNNNLHWRNSFYWDKKAMYHGADDWNAATVLNWKASSNSYIVPALSSMRVPGQGRVWFNYPGQTAVDGSVNSYMASKTVRQIENENGTPIWVMTQATFNSLGLPLTTTDELGRLTQIQYAGNQQDPISISAQGVGTLRSFSYIGSPAHLPSSITEASGVVTNYTYNSRQQITQVKKSRGGENEATRFTYSDSRSGTVSPWPGTPGFLRRIERTSPVNPEQWITTQEITYDSANRQLTNTDASGYTLTSDYDNLDRPTIATHPDGTFEQFHYDRLDLASTKDRAGRWARVLYNSERKVTAQIAPDGNTTQFEWCLCGGLQKLTDALGRETKWIWSPGGYLLEKIMPDGITKFTQSYEPNSGRLASVTRPNQQGQGQPTVIYRYHVDGRIQKEDYTDNSEITGAGDVIYNYETSGLGRLTAVTDAIGTHTFSYRSLASEGGGAVEYINGPFTNDRIQCIYDWQDRVCAEKLINDSNFSELRAESRTWDSLGRAATVINSLGAFSYGYNTGLPRPDTLQRPGGISTTFTFRANDANGPSSQALEKISHARADGTVISSHTYGYDLVGRIISWKQQGDGLSSVTRRFEYNLGDKLILAEKVRDGDNVTLDSEHWSLDGVGNWLAHTQQNGTLMETRQFNVLNQLTNVGGAGSMLVEGTVNEFAKISVNDSTARLSVDPISGYRYRRNVKVQPGANSVTVKAVDTNGEVTAKKWQFTVPSSIQPLSYDADGNTLGDGLRSFTWDVKGRLRSVSKGGITWKWDYDYKDRRVREYQNNVVTKIFIWRGSDVVQERDGSNAITRTHFDGGFSDGPVSSSGIKFQILADHLGHVREVMTSAGGIAARYDYTNSQGPIKISGDTVEATFQTIGRYYHHSGSGLDLALYRAYDQQNGRWLSRDPLGEKGGVNLYGFVENDPVTFSDQVGHDRAVSVDYIGHTKIWYTNYDQEGKPDGYCMAEFGPNPADLGGRLLANYVIGKTASGLATGTLARRIPWLSAALTLGNMDGQVWVYDSNHVSAFNGPPSSADIIPSTQEQDSVLNATLCQTRQSPPDYNILFYNCRHFTNQMSQVGIDTEGSYSRSWDQWIPIFPPAY
ncbi:MAG: RHS repeat-associated core domain-containing protein [Prosthecobacter sp.]